MAIIVWILLSVFIYVAVTVHGQAAATLSLRACPISHAEVNDVCQVYPASQPGGSQGIMRASAWTYNAQGCSFGRVRSLFRFEQLNLIPPCAKIVSAKLQLYGAGPNNSYSQGAFSQYPGSPFSSYGSNEVLILRLAGPWTASTVTWNTQPATTGPAATIPTSTAQYFYNPLVDLTSQVQAMVQSGQTDYGFMLRLTTEQYYRCMFFYSSLEANVNLRPLLQVNYSVPCGCAPCNNKI